MKRLILETPIIALLLCVVGLLLGVIIDLATGTQGMPIVGNITGLVIGFVIVARKHGQKFFKMLNPFYGGNRHFAIEMIVNAPESTVFNFCASAVDANGLRYELHEALGEIQASRRGGSCIFANMHVSEGMYLFVKINPDESGTTCVQVGAESQRGFYSLWMPSLAERWLYETRDLVAAVVDTLDQICARKGVQYNIQGEISFRTE
jgi:hypothetical protein